MFTKLTTKIALRKVGLPSNSLSFDSTSPSSNGGLAPPFANPFAGLKVPASWQAWQTPMPPPVEVASPPVIDAEKTFLELRRLANKHPSLCFIAVSHSSPRATEKWVAALGGAWAVRVVVDEERELYARWGLGVSSTWYVLNPWTQMAMAKLGKEQGIWGREVDPSGNKWQLGGAWAVDRRGVVVWGGQDERLEEGGDLVMGCKLLGF
ncbi:hypothetical protein B7494_g5469 [Chlorociboria aeruginascens]|nr:hypothetical protein B7494_g5469 [Chlorociboria aeruginascens]